MPSNLFHIAEARFYPEWTLLGVYADSRMVGFAMYGLDHHIRLCKFIHFMIDGREQGKGYKGCDGATASQDPQGFHPDQEIWLSLHPQNMVAIRLYKDYGFEFQAIGLETDDEVFMCLRSL